LVNISLIYKFLKFGVGAKLFSLAVGLIYVLVGYKTAGFRIPSSMELVVRFLDL
jgi:hypothetical protein